MSRSYESITRKKFQIIEPMDPSTTRHVLMGRTESFVRDLVQPENLPTLREYLRYYLSGRIPRLLRQERESRCIRVEDWVKASRRTKRELRLAEHGMDIEGARWIAWSLQEASWDLQEAYQVRLDGELDLQRQISLYMSFWRGLLKNARERSGITKAEIVNSLNLTGESALNNIETYYRPSLMSAARIGAFIMQISRDHDLSRFLQYEMEMASTDARWRGFVENPWLKLRRKFYLDPYQAAGLVGAGVKSWVRWECGFFLGDEEEVLARAALQILKDQDLMDALFKQRLKEAPFCGRMKRIRREFSLTTYQRAVEHFKINTRNMSHYWAVLENGCATDTAQEGALKKLTALIYRAQDWKSIRRRLSCLR